jgi:lysophospholipase L1-like esterase
MQKIKAALILCTATILYCAASVPTVAQDTQPANPALHETSRAGWWMTKHNAILARNKQGGVDLVFLGDSITQNYEKHQPPNQDFLPTWDKFYGDRNAENMGFSGDQTGHLLWRIDNGELDGITPKVAVIMIGTNNTAARQSADDTTIGIETVVDRVEEKLPATKILLLGILPTDLPTPPGKAATDAAINQSLASKYAGAAKVTFLDIGSIYLKDGKVDWSLFYDPTLPPLNGVKRGPLHPNTVGQRMMAQAIEPTLARLMGDQSKVDAAKPATAP